MSMKRAVLAALALSLSFSAYAAPDVSGIELGSAFSAARPLMMKANAGYEITDLKRNGKVAGYSALFVKDGAPVDQLVVLQNAAGAVWFVARAQRLAQGERIKHETLLATLRAKYGPESGISLGSNGPSWQFNRAGALFKGDPSTGPCVGLVSGSPAMVGKVPSANINVPSNYPAGCSTSVNAPLVVDQDGMVTHFSLHLIDVKAAYDELSGNEAAAKTEHQRKLEAERARDVKPKL
jgi:hypothetical protein